MRKLLRTQAPPWTAARTVTSSFSDSAPSSPPHDAHEGPQQHRHTRERKGFKGKRQPHQQQRRDGRPSEKGDKNAPYRASPYTTPPTGFYGPTSVPRSLDIGAQEELMDVERFFPEAMAHLKAHPTTPAVAADKDARRWHDVTHTLNVDGFRPPSKGTEEDEAAQVHSFFDQGSLDIRGGLRDAQQQQQQQQRQRPSGGAAAHGRDGVALFAASSVLPPQSREERLSPDVLQLTGGKTRVHGAALAAASNAAPADQTLEAEDGNYAGKKGDTGSAFHDTPVQLTDMLRERLMELKGDRLREERNDTFMPRRLSLKSDAELARERRGHAKDNLLLQLATTAASAGGLRRSRTTTKTTTTTTLADLADGEDDAAASLSAAAGAASVPAILRDGASAEQRRQAADVLRGVSAGDASRDAALDVLDDLDRPFGGAAFDDAGPHDGRDGVYLLRLLPRASFCSRREAAAIVASGQVRVNNVVERNPFRLVKAEDDVHVAGHPSRLRFAPPRLWIYHKPANVVVSRHDVAGRTLIGKHARILGMDHLIPVGSLPMRAHGILLLTNDGELSRFLENPRANVQQTYLLRVRPAIDAVLANKLNTEGININGRQYKGAMEFMVNPAAKSRYSVKVKVRGETMPIAHVMQHLGRKIERGGRMSFGPFSLSTLPVGSLREVTVPRFYADHLGAAWKPFVDRDWPYFRRQRASRLRRLARFRELTPRELEELDDFTYEEMHDALRLDEQELEAAAEAREVAELRAQHQRPSFFHGEALTADFPRSRAGRGADDVGTLDGTEWADGRHGGDEDEILADITSVM